MQVFLDFLAGPARSAKRLTILGDLFDAWAGDDDLSDPFNARVVAALRALADAGVEVAFMAGNRDFLIGADFAAAAGLALLPDPWVRDVAGVRTLLTHGDLLCTDDLAYQRFRAQVRNPDWQAGFLARPLEERKREIAALRMRSEAAKLHKPAEIMDVNTAAVTEALAEHRALALIHGHTHRQGCHAYRVEGTECLRWALGDWRPGRGNALLCETAGWRWLELAS